MYENKTVILKLGNLTEDSTTVKKKKNQKSEKSEFPRSFADE